MVPGQATADMTRADTKLIDPAADPHIVH